MKNNSNIAYSFFLIVGDFLALVSAFVSAYILRVSLDDKPFLAISSSEYLKAFLILLPFWLLIFGSLGLYSKKNFDNRFAEFGNLIMGSFLGILFVISYSYITNTAIFPARLVTIYGFGLALCYLLLFRTLARATKRWLFSYGVGVNNVLVVGSTHITPELIKSLSNTKVTGYRVVGVVTNNKKDIKKHFKDLAIYDSFERATNSFKSGQVHSIVQTELYSDTYENDKILTYAQQNHISYRFIPGNSELFVGNIDVDLFQSFPIISVNQTALLGWGRVVKRAFDLFVGSILLILTLPLMIIISILIKLSDGGPVFLRQVRLTQYNKEFRVFKFRSHNQKYNGLTPDEAFEKMGRLDLLKKFRDNGNFLINDPRETKVGKFIRKASLDEIPQLFNVLKGELSLVGPRALIPKDLAEYAKKHTILSVKSGMTGLAQVSGRNNIPFEQRRTLDVYYVQNWSFWLDLVILGKTLRSVLTKENEEK